MERKKERPIFSFFILDRRCVFFLFLIFDETPGTWLDKSLFFFFFFSLRARARAIKLKTRRNRSAKLLLSFLFFKPAKKKTQILISNLLPWSYSVVEHVLSTTALCAVTRGGRRTLVCFVSSFEGIKRTDL